MMRDTDSSIQHIIDFYLEPKTEWARSRIERVLQSVSVGQSFEGERILDLGCANATFSFHTSRLGGFPVGLDRDEAVLRTGRAAALEAGGVATPRVRGDALRLPFRDNSFDVVINADFIEHTPDDIKEPIFQEMHRVMKPGGRGVVYTPNINRVVWELRGEKIKRLAGARKAPVPEWNDFVDPDHFGLTDPHKTFKRLQSAGFETELAYFEFHIPFLSKIPGINALLAPLLSSQFANRFLIRLRK